MATQPSASGRASRLHLPRRLIAAALFAGLLWSGEARPGQVPVIGPNPRRPAPPEPMPAGLREQIAALIAQLNGGDEKAAQAAHASLVDIGGFASSALEAQARGVDAEKALRAKKVIEDVTKRADAMLAEAAKAESAASVKPVTPADMEEIRTMYQRVVKYAAPGPMRDAAEQRSQSCEREIEVLKRGQTRLKIIEQKLKAQLEPEMLAYYLKERGNILLKSHDFAAAMEAADRLLKEVPDSRWAADAYFIRGKSSVAARDAKAFEDDMRIVISKYPYCDAGRAAFNTLLDYYQFRNRAQDAADLARVYWKTFPGDEDVLERRLENLDWLFEDRHEYAVSAAECSAILSDVPLSRLRYEVPFMAAKCYEYPLEDFDKAEAMYRTILEKFPESAQAEDGELMRRNLKRVQAKREKKAKGEPILPAIPEADRTATPQNAFWTFVRGVRLRDEGLIMQSVATGERNKVWEQVQDMSDSVHADYVIGDFRPEKAGDRRGQLTLTVEKELPDDLEADTLFVKIVKDGEQYRVSIERERRKPPPKPGDAKAPPNPETPAKAGQPVEEPKKPQQPDQPPGK